MRKTVIPLLLLIGTFLATQQVLNGQTNPAPTASDQDIELLRKDLRSMKKQLVAANMRLTDVEAQKFWPVYDRYVQETIRINDARYALIKEYVTNFGKMTDEQARNFTRRLIDVDDAVLRLRSRYVPLLNDVLPSMKTALFFQLDRRIGLLIDLQLASEIPLVQP